MRLVALLRAVNVGGTSVVKMAALRGAFEKVGFRDVTTVGASGNIVFDAETTQAKARSLAASALAKVGVRGQLFLFTPEELEAAANANPLAPAATEQCQILFLDAEPNAFSVKTLLSMAEPEYRFAVKGNVAYYAYDKSWAGRRRAIDFEGILGTAGTARTHKVVGKLIEVAREAKTA